MRPRIARDLNTINVASSSSSPLSRLLARDAVPGRRQRAEPLRRYRPGTGLTEAEGPPHQARLGRLDLREHPTVAFLQAGKKTARGFRRRVVHELAGLVPFTSDELHIRRREGVGHVTTIAVQAPLELFNPPCSMTGHRTFAPSHRANAAGERHSLPGGAGRVATRALRPPPSPPFPYRESSPATRKDMHRNCQTRMPELRVVTKPSGDGDAGAPHRCGASTPDGVS